MDHLPNAPDGHPLRNPDAAKRLADTFRLHQQVLTMDEMLDGRWIAVRLGDGGSDNTAYDSHEAAVNSARNAPSRCFYPRILPEAMTVPVCDFLLWYARTVYDNGWRQDPAGERQLIMPTRVEDVRNRTRKEVRW
jgi:hypothetical protein